MVTLNDAQRTALAAARAWRDEGERRFDYWSQRETHAEATEAFAQRLQESGLRSGQPLTEETRLQLLRLASELAPNAHLSRRLYAGDPKDFDRRLRVLFYSDDPLPDRLRTFLEVRGTGALTASQLLCAFQPETYPLITRSGLRRLRLTAQQRREAAQEAAERYGFAASDTLLDTSEALLSLFLIYETVRDALGVTSYPDVDAMLRADWTVLPTLNSVASGNHIRELQSTYHASPPALTEAALLGVLEDYALSQGFHFPPYLLRSYYIALKTKPFAILSGVSGTGKTKLAELFAESLTGHHPEQFRLIPVRPDWADSSALFGYHNLMSGRYVSTPFLDLARQAIRPENRQKTFFLCLDEMNLARVEHYFADYLSALESRTHRIPLHESVPDLILPPNFFVTGTVNVDETTHIFSRKVLDRANTLDFDSAPLLIAGLNSSAKGIGTLDNELSATPTQRQALFLASRVPNVGRAREKLAHINSTIPEHILSTLQAANDLLYASRLHFGYRVRDEILMFLANSFDSENQQGLLLPDPETNLALAFDLQVMQKILPKLNGLAEQLDSLLIQIIAWAETTHLPMTAAKLARMRTQGIASGYIRFYE